MPRLSTSKRVTAMRDRENDEKQSAGKDSVQSESRLKVSVKVGILHTIAGAIYGTAAGKIREAVANSRDNGASWVIINVDRTSRTISIFDNGSGITRKRFQEIFESIGHPLPLPGLERKVSYFGLGLMSIFQLGKRVRIFTRPTGKTQFNLLEVDTDSVFDPTNKDQPISYLNNFITVRDASSLDRPKSPAPVLDGFVESVSIDGFPDNFTEIVVEEVTPENLEKICDGDFEDDLRKRLPLRVEKDEPFLKRFPDINIRRDIMNVLQNDDYCRTIDVYFGVEGEREIKQLWKYFPHFRSDLDFPKDNVYVGIAESDEFAYYIVHTIAEDMHRPGYDEERETGFWVRNQNFLVRDAHFLKKPGPGPHIIHKPLRSWIFGEIFHRDMNAFLTVARDDYLYQEPAFGEFRQEVIEIVGNLNKELREIWQEKDRIKKDLIEPFATIAESKGAIKKTEKKLRRLMGQGLSDKEFQERALEQLRSQRRQNIEVEAASMDAILAQGSRAIILAEDANALVQVDPRLKGKVDDYQVMWDATHKRVTVSLSPDLFAPTKVVFLGKTFTVIFVAKDQTDPGVSINVDKKRIYLNPFNQELSMYSISILDIYLALEVANSMSNSQKELKKNFLELLGPASSDVVRYIVPLGEDLRRTFRESVKAR